LNGILPRCAQYLFSKIDQLTSAGAYVDNNMYNKTEYKIRTSYLEIWNEQINDLLNLSSTNLPVRWRNSDGFFVENLYVVNCLNVEDFMAVVTEGISNRRVASHDLNKDSSRSHTIFTIYIDIGVEDVRHSNTIFTKFGKVQIVDLAGSERLKESNSKGGTAVETGHINKSLLTLGKVINRLGDPKRISIKDNYIPYRDSKLTKLLMDSIGGSSKTIMIACITRSSLYSEETLNTLKYANRVKNIKNKPIANIDPYEAHVQELKEKIRKFIIKYYF
jgi:kinesin family protein 12